MAYTTINKSTDNFNTKLYAGNGSTNAITGVGFQPDWVWCKERGASGDHRLFDAVRGATKDLVSNNSDAEATSSTSLTAFNTDGFTLGSEGGINGSSDTFASLNWKAGTTSGIATNGSTTITPTAYSFNQTAGFSIVKFAGNETSGAKLAHGLGAVPSLMIFKQLSGTGPNGWNVYHQSLGNTKYIMMNTTAAAITSSSRWNDTTPDSVNVTLGSSDGVSVADGDMVAYIFAEKTGYSKFSSYIGNGNNDGTFVYTGFKPKFLMIKRTDSSDNWVIFDDSRLGYNDANYRLYSNLGAAEEGGGKLDILSNGFKTRANWTTANASGGTHIYMAFGQTMVGTNDIPATAR